ncbi:hypothetical protein AM500_07995 [Bacillus sp. FJAT-18017]|jgi:uncharacterized membrane protein YsdA (DUF1294 family)|uniref:DUF1294 domain-containing protein n=1 Tax=Bacillus sp. FJAT-18017 TaxID=1705566 RepID=UPI0006AECAEA|nr:DUF1294 domain-containing protein [Bacillus sp. FJAT-18017]ALC89716.1 hypothetical protein AM500_07995 [Bacillus sp. FJAT-18017]
MEKAIFIYLLVINIISFSMMGIDKRRARNGQYRISEQTLWLSALAGGAIGATIGMNYFRHKTKHVSFKFGLPLLAAIEILAIFYAAAKLF